MSEKNSTSMGTKHKLSQVLILECILDCVLQHTTVQMPYLVEKQARKALGVVSVPVGYEKTEASSSGKQKKKSKDKGSADILYHNDFTKFNSCIDFINDQLTEKVEFILPTKKQSFIMNKDQSPLLPQNSKHLDAKRKPTMSKKDKRNEDFFDLVSVFLEISAVTNVFEPISRELDETDIDYMPFGS